MKPINRRKMIQLGGMGLLSLGLAQRAEGGAFFWGKLFSVPPRDTPYITPNDKFYLVNYSDHSLESTKNINLGQWKLSITGMVDQPLTLGYADFLGKEFVEKMVTLQCIDNLPGGNSIGNALWGGLPLRKLLGEVKPFSDVKDVIFRGADGYHDSITFERAMDGEVLLAHSMNGVQLPREHGFPLRAVVPGIYGIKNVKWLTNIELVGHDHQGYWQEKGWTDKGIMKITSRIDSPGHYQEIKKDQHTIEGIAFGGLHGISTVEISTDGERTWHPTIIEPPSSDLSWVKWKYPWSIPQKGAYSLTVRALDRKGQPQISQVARAYPDGSSGLHTIVALAKI